MKDVDGKGAEVVMASEDKGKQLLEQKPEAVPRGDEGVVRNPNYQAYPRPLASYQDVVSDKSFFMETLEKLHAVMRTKFMIPVIGGKELDLHRLFVEVTSRGGIEKVIGDRRWKEVTNVFNFPSTATNASFILRKYYMSLLRHYEQIYFFGAKGWSIPSPVSLSFVSSTPFRPERGSESVQLYPDIQSANLKRRRGSAEATLTGPALPTNQEISGVIDGKFEEGYFVTVMVGATKLKGILFHVPEQNLVQRLPGTTGYCSSRFGRHRRRRKKLSSMDPSHPKPNRSGYNFFFAEQHAKLKLIHSGKDREISRMIGDLWNKLTENEKAVYQERGLKDKERYQSEMAVYKERLRTGQVLSNVMPIQQRPVDPSINMQDMGSKMEVGEGNLPSEDDGIDTEEEKSDDESELATSPETGGAPTESTSIVADPSAVGDAFELRKRDGYKMGNEQDPHTTSTEDADTERAGEPPTDNQ